MTTVTIAQIEAAVAEALAAFEAAQKAIEAAQTNEAHQEATADALRKLDVYLIAQSVLAAARAA